MKKSSFSLRFTHADSATILMCSVSPLALIRSVGPATILAVWSVACIPVLAASEPAYSQSGITLAANVESSGGTGGKSSNGNGGVAGTIGAEGVGGSGGAGGGTPPGAGAGGVAGGVGASTVDPASTISVSGEDGGRGQTA